MTTSVVQIDFDKSRLDRLATLIVSAGKSPATDVSTMISACEMYQWIQQQIDAHTRGHATSSTDEGAGDQ